MKKAFVAVVTSVITFLFIAALNFFPERWVEQERGSVLVGPSVSVAGSYYLPIDIANYEEAQLDGMVISMPSEIETSKIASSTPLQAELITNSLSGGDSKKLRFSGIEGQRVTRILVPLPKGQGQANLVRVVNNGTLKLKVNTSGETPDPLWMALRSALMRSIFVSGGNLIGFLLIGLWIHQRLGEETRDLRRKLSQNKALLEKRGQELQEFEEHLSRSGKELQEVKNIGRRTRILLLARLTDYRKELSFWRDTIRKLLYGKDADAQALLASVTENLKTYGTRARDDEMFDAETVKIFAGLLTPSTEAEYPLPPPRKPDSVLLAKIAEAEEVEREAQTSPKDQR